MFIAKINKFHNHKFLRTNFPFCNKNIPVSSSTWPSLRFGAGTAEVTEEREARPDLSPVTAPSRRSRFVTADIMATCRPCQRLEASPGPRVSRLGSDITRESENLSARSPAASFLVVTSCLALLMSCSWRRKSSTWYPRSWVRTSFWLTGWLGEFLNSSQSPENL